MGQLRRFALFPLTLRLANLLQLLVQMAQEKQRYFALSLG
jgi:hypothetical protein